MTQDLLDQPDSSQLGEKQLSGKSGWGDDVQSADFSYKPVSPWGMVAIVLGLCGLTAFLGVFGIALAALGLVVSVAAIVRIRGEMEMVRGMLMAVLALLLSVTCVSGGIVSQIYHYNHEVPEGFQRVSFPEEISARQFLYYGGGQRRLHPEVAKLVGKKIFVKGFMWLTQQDTDLEDFVFLKDNGECCFGGSPKPYDMMLVEMPEGRTVDGHTGMVSVAGILRTNVAAAEEEAVYILEAQTVEPSRTRF